MSRKHFIAIAAIIRDERALIERLRMTPAEMTCRLVSLNNIARNLAGFLASTNPNFNRSRFLTACGVTAGEC